MKNEIKIIIGLCVVIGISITINTLQLSDNRTTDKDYQATLIERDKAVKELRNVRTELNNRNTEFEEYKQTTDRIVQRLNDTINNSGKVTESLQDIRDTIETENSNIGKEVKGIGRILQEVETQPID